MDNNKTRVFDGSVPIPRRDDNVPIPDSYSPDSFRAAAIQAMDELHDAIVNVAKGNTDTSGTATTIPNPTILEDIAFITKGIADGTFVINPDGSGISNNIDMGAIQPIPGANEFMTKEGMLTIDPKSVVGTETQSGAYTRKETGLMNEVEKQAITGDEDAKLQETLRLNEKEYQRLVDEANTAPVMPEIATYNNTTTGEQVILDKAPVKEPRKPSTNTVQESEIFTPLENPKDIENIGLSLPSDTAENIEAALSAMPNVEIQDSPEGLEWMQRISLAKYTTPYKGWFDRTVARDDSMYKQSVKSEKGPLTAGGLKFNDSLGSKLTGERAVLRVRALTGLGSVIMVPLWHSGFWITLKAPTESAMLELNRRLTEEKIQLGRATYGLAFANTSVFFAGWLIDFALSHVYDTSLKPDVATDLRSRISTLDIPLVIWGLSCSIWPSGFPYARAVLDQTTHQNKIIKEKINIGKILWVDNSSLSAWQISHMAQRHGSTMTADSLERYKSEFVRGKGRSIELTPSMSMTLRVPNIDQYLVSGQKWVNNIVSMVDRAMGAPPDENTRDTYIMDQGKATNMRQFSHFVESLEAGGDLIEDVETLEQTFDVLSSSDDIREKFFKGVKEFIEDSTMAIVAIPVTEDQEKSDLPRFPHLLPIDVMSVFFTQLVYKTTQIQDRG